MIGALNRLGVEVRRGLSQFAVGSKEPSLGFDFIDNTYLADGTKNLSQALTHSRSGNATMTDGYGPELVANGDFSSGASSWNTSNASIAADSGVATVSVSANGTAHINQALSTEVGKTYIASIKFIEDSLTGNLFLYAGTSAGSGSSGNLNMGSTVGSYELVFVAAAATTYISVSSSSSAVADDFFRIDNVSVREMPVIKWAPHNLLTYSEDFSNAAWVTGGTITTNATTAPDGQITADLLESGGSLVNLQTVVSLTAGDYTLSFWAKNVDATGALVNVYNLTTASAVLNTSNYIPELSTTSWVKIERSFTLPADGSIRFQIARDLNANASLYYWGAHVYRSDLGGMVDNPERGDSYVPTAARPFGPELVTNGTFDSDTSGWTAYNYQGHGVTLSSVSQQLAVDNDPVNGGSAAAYYTLSTNIGSVYSVSVDLISADVGNPSVLIRNAVASSSIASVITSGAGTYELTFVANATTTLIILNHNAVSANSRVVWDNVSVRQSSVDPSAASYLPRVGHHVYNGDAWVNEGLLHESEARTNLFTYSEDFTDASWSKTNTATLAVDAVGPDGKVSAVTLVDSGATGSGDVRKNYNVTVSTSTAYTYSEYFKADQLGWALMWASGFTTPANGGAYFDLSNGVIGTISSGYTATMESVGNGWYRCSITFTTDPTDTSGMLQAYVSDGDGSFTVDRDGTSSILTYGAQFEAGSTPSSYIPTAGATVTRAAETLTVPAANLPWPYPEVIGPELVTNGTFDTDSDWTKGTGWSISGGVAVGSSTSLNLQQAITVTLGKVYLVSFEITSNTAGSINRVQIASQAGPTLNASSEGVYTSVIVSPASGAQQFYLVGSGFSGSIDNISVREINPLSVSLAMKGAMTYADTDATIEVNQYQWLRNPVNFIRASVKTTTSRTGSQEFYQRQDTQDGVVGPNTYYSPGVLVPFNIASRHGSTFVNGAVDGVALTEDTTPVALPDLSATDLDLGVDYMGTIGTFRVWNQDLGDDGIVTATAPSLEPSLSLTFDGSGLSFTVLDWSE